MQEQLAILSTAIEKILGPEAAAPEIKRLRDIAHENPHLVDSLLTEAIRQWRTSFMLQEVYRIVDLCPNPNLPTPTRGELP
jgi:hypothetical protein